MTKRIKVVASDLQIGDRIVCPKVDVPDWPEVVETVTEVKRVVDYIKWSTDGRRSGKTHRNNMVEIEVAS